MEIRVKTLTGKEIPVLATDMMTVEQLKLELEKIDGMPPDQQRLIFAAQQVSGLHSLRRSSSF